MQGAGLRVRLGRVALIVPVAIVALLVGAVLLMPKDDRRMECAWAGLASLIDVFGFQEARQLANEIAGGIRDGSLRARRYEEGAATEFTAYARIPERLVQAVLRAEFGARSVWERPQLTGRRSCITATQAEFLVEGFSEIRTEQSSISKVTVGLVFAVAPHIRTEESLPKHTIIAGAAFLIERSDVVSWEQVVEYFMNFQYFGAKAYGVANAGRVYFGKPLDQLSLAEIAYLAALPRAPNSNRRGLRTEEAISRRNAILQDMARAGVVPAEEAAMAAQQPLVTVLR